MLVQNQSDWTGKARQGSSPYLELIGLFTLSTMLLCFTNGMLTKIVIFPRLVCKQRRHTIRMLLIPNISIENNSKNVNNPKK